jgi:hypothetical protein
MARVFRGSVSVLVLIAGSACVASPPAASTPPASATVALATSSPPVSAAPPGSASAASPCFAAPPPTYLPWGTVTPPQRVITKPGVAVDRYIGPSIMPGPIGTTTTPLEFDIGRALPKDLNEEVPAVPAREVAGRMIQIYRIGDPGVGMVGARWQEGMDGCDYFAGLYFPRGTNSDDEEIAKIIASLDPWAAARAQLSSSVAVLRPTYLPPRFRNPPWLLSVFDTPINGPRYLIGYASGTESLHFVLGASNSAAPTSSTAIDLRGVSGMLQTTTNWPAIGVYWTEGGSHYAIQDGSIATRDEMLRIIRGLAAL